MKQGVIFCFQQWFSQLLRNVLVSDHYVHPLVKLSNDGPRLVGLRRPPFPEMGVFSRNDAPFLPSPPPAQAVFAMLRVRLALRQGMTAEALGPRVKR